MKPTKNIDSDHPLIIQKARELTQNCRTDPAEARMLYEFVRNSYNNNSSGSFKASDVLIYGGNNCIRRSILLSALCRAVGIPTRLHILEFSVRDYCFEDGRVGDLKGPHVVTGIYLNKGWHLYEATGNAKKWISLNQDESCASEMPVRFYPDRDCLFLSNDSVKFKRSLLYFADWSDTADDLSAIILEMMFSFIMSKGLTFHV